MFAAIYIPNFSLQAVLRHEPALHTQPVVLLYPDLLKPQVIQMTAAAEAFDVRVGMTASQATARCAHLHIKSRSLAQENATTEILLQTACAFSPNLEDTALGVCTLDLKGLDLSSPGAWARKIVDALAQVSLAARIGMGVTPELALLAAQGTETISIIEDADEFVEELPVAALTPPPEILDILRRWGIRTAGEFLALGKDAVAERLGPVALDMFQKVSPDAIRPLKLVLPSEEFVEQMEFEAEVETMAPLLFWLRRFVEQLTRRLEAIYLVTSELKLRLGLASGDKYERVLKIPSPSGDVEILFRALQTHLESLHTESPIVSLELAAVPTRPDMHQFGLFQNTLRDPNQFAETLARLVALVGSENVGSPALASTHKPDSFRLHIPNFEFVPTRDRHMKLDDDGLQLRRFRPPLPAQFEFLGDIPSRLCCRIFDGAITDTRGPFLSSGNWWDDSRWAREEWDVATASGAMLRIFRSNNGCFVEGVYD